MMLPSLPILLLFFQVVDSKKLLFAHAIWRHGVRSTVGSYPSSPYGEDFWVPGPEGELVSIGMEEHIRLGQKLKQRYVVENNLISRRYKSKEVHIRSSNYNRTIVSAMVNMAGFYFAEGLAGIDYPYHWQWPTFWTPVPVHNVPWENDTVR